MNKQLSAALLLCPFLVLAGWSMYYMSFTREAPEIVLPIRGYDPRNLLSGHYIQFQIDWAEADCYQADWSGVCPRSAFNGVDRYYVPEDDALPLERKINAGISASVVFSYKKGMRPLAKKLLLEGRPWQEYVKTHPAYENEFCYSQGMCGGIGSGYFCNDKGNYTPNKCQKTNYETITLNGQEFYYNKLSDLKSWCREARESQEDRNSPGNCNWGYLSYEGAESWCASIGKHLVSAEEIEKNCEQFSFLPMANPDQQYWARNMMVVHMGQNCSIQSMVRGDGYTWAGGVICK